MFEAKLAEGHILKKIIEAIKDLVTDVNIDVTPSGKYTINRSHSNLFNIGLSLQAMDTSHVALVSLNLSSEGFEEFRCDNNVVLGINILNLSKVLKLADATDSITLQADQDASTLKIIFQNPKSQRTTEFALNLITLEVEHLSIPETEYSSLITINSGEFSKICKELQTLSDSLTIVTQPDNVQLLVEGQAGSGFIKLTANDSDRKEDQTTIEVEESVTQQFALNYLNLFNKAANLSTFTRLALHQEQPLVTEFKIDQLGVLKYYLAPKISDE
jgi:proliferating cell nuclear antigen